MTRRFEQDETPSVRGTGQIGFVQYLCLNVCRLGVVLAVVLTASGCETSSEPFDSAMAGSAFRQNDFATAEKLYRAGAAQGNAEAQYGLGRMYQLGWGVPQDYREAVKWFRLAVDKGHLDARYQLAFLTINGQGTDRDVNDGIKLLVSAAEKGHVPSQLYLSNGYRTGIGGLPRDYARAAMWQRVAYCSYQEYLNSLPDRRSAPTSLPGAVARPQDQLLNRSDILSPEEIAVARNMVEQWIHARVATNADVRAIMPIDCL